MTPLQRIRIQQSEHREKINALLLVESELDDGQRGELAGLTTRMQHLELEYRAAEMADGPMETADDVPVVSKDQRQRLELRSAAKLTNYLLSHAQGKMPSGAELELQQEAKVNGIPAELFDVATRETRADSLAPTTGTGINVDPVRPMLYARAVLPRLGVAMPRVGSGAYSTMTISAGLTAAATTAGSAFDATAAVLTPQTTSAHRVTGRLSLRAEDIATVGPDNFESSLRQNLMLVMSDELDKLGLNGNGTAPNPEGLFPQLTDPTDGSVIVTWPLFVAAMAGGIDGGPWAETLQEVMMLVNPETMRLAESTFQKGTGESGNPRRHKRRCLPPGEHFRVLQ